MTRPTLHLIAGPTASGKSALALEIARRENGTVINADAMQVYAGLPVLTAQPSQKDRTDIPHELYEIFDPSERSSVGKWLPLAESAIRRAVEAGRTPIVVGGTGLYFKALLEGIADIPDIPETVREETKNLYAKLGPDAFRAELAKRDPESAARLKPNDKQRLIRAYEVAAHTGKPIGFWQTRTPRHCEPPLGGEAMTDQSSPPGSAKSPSPPNGRRGVGVRWGHSNDAPAATSPKTIRSCRTVARGSTPALFCAKSAAAEGRGAADKEFRLDNFTIIPHLLLPPREELYAACDRRFLEMMEHGAVDEVRALLKRNLDPALPAMKILGVREIAAFLRGELICEEAIKKAQQVTRNYAKRQMTWFRNQGLRIEARDSCNTSGSMK